MGGEGACCEWTIRRDFCLGTPASPGTIFFFFWSFPVVPILRQPFEIRKGERGRKK
jgi:hypothetical protein